MLDACEHVAAEVAACVQVILTGAPGVRVLVSSRQSLGLTGEVVLRLEPLQVPSVDAADDELARSPSVRLFLERSRGSGTPDVAELRLIGELCRFLDGLPLAIELVAATSRGLAMSDVLARLPSRLALDRGPEGDVAVRPAIAWSHDMLPPGDRAVFRRLSVFAAGFSYRGAVAVAAPGDGPEAVGGSLARLVQASLISVDPRATPARYRMLDTVREYAAEQLAVSGEVDDGARPARDPPRGGGRRGAHQLGRGPRLPGARPARRRARQLPQHPRRHAHPRRGRGGAGARHRLERVLVRAWVLG